MKEQVSHKGRIIRMTPQTTTVAIEQHAACSTCHAAGLCGMADVAEKAVEVPTDPYAPYGVGDEVEVVLKASMGMKEEKVTLSPTKTTSAEFFGNP